ncbi:hypothetical protein [Aestuariimicrobium ganziense]|uniref:hypothetical protein n=1 Tax=Aestuariimicrobium ganziense TaxID=2773677 RepID=UPI001941E497|nr:hypothetical protein [Aestuariimicrobium ganziense]
MHTLPQLLLTIAPLVVFASISPVLFLNAGTAVSRGGVKGGWQFIAGCAAVIIVLGTASVGVLGTVASDFAERQIASKAVDRVLGVALFGYGCWLAFSHWRSHVGTADESSDEKPASDNSLWLWGVISMATNFTTLPVFVSLSQRIGASGLDWAVKIIVLVVCSLCVLTPAWFPTAVAHLFPGRADVNPTLGRRIRLWSGLASTLACLAGGVVLVITSL